MLFIDTLFMKYKALIIDVDGTLIPNRENGMPSEKVAKAIAAASQYLHISVASNRPPFLLTHILKSLKLSGPFIASGGAQVMDFPTGKVFYRQPLENKDLKKAYEIARKHGAEFRVDDDIKEMLISGRIPKGEILGAFIPALDLDVINKINEELNSIPTVSTHVTPSWTKGKWTISISHAKATKQHGIWEIAKILGVKTEDIIGVGDGYNDFPLLMACGLKVAMGNAVEDLKAIADYIAPTVEEDGVADVVHKFILNK